MWVESLQFVFVELTVASTVWLLGTLFLTSKKNKPILTIALLLLLIGFCLIMLNNEWDVQWVEILLMIVVIFIYFEGSLLSKFITLFHSFLFITVHEMVLDFSNNLLLLQSYSMMDLQGRYIFAIANSLLALFTILIIKLIFQKKVSGVVFNIEESSLFLKLLSLVIDIGLIVSLISIVLLINEPVPKTIYYLLIVIFIILVASFFAILYSNVLSTSNKIQQEKNGLLKKLLQNKSDYYVQMDISNRALRAKKHDINHHMLMLDALIAANNPLQARQYLNQIRSEIQQVEQVMQTGNGVFDTILNDKIQRAKKHAIVLHFKGNLPQGEFINYIDLCTMTANVLDNAIEAQIDGAIDEKFITVSSQIKQNHWVFKVVNPTHQTLFNNKQRFITRKKDPINHGFGIENVKNAVAKYGGAFNIKQIENTVHCDILIPLLD